MIWQLNKIQYPIYNLGLGKRIGIWVQGCTLSCEGCVNQKLWNRTGGEGVPVLDIANWVLANQDVYDGITISGGEPFQQYEQLITFLHLIKSKSSLTVHCFSGYYLSELEQLFPDKLFLRYIDTLVDGRYIQTQHDNSNIKGSLNQTIYQIVHGTARKDNAFPSPRKWSISIDTDRTIYMAGIPRKDELKSVCEELSKVGIHKQFK